MYKPMLNARDAALEGLARGDIARDAALLIHRRWIEPSVLTLDVRFRPEADAEATNEATRAPSGCSQGLCAWWIDSRMFFRYR